MIETKQKNMAPPVVQKAAYYTAIYDVYYIVLRVYTIQCKGAQTESGHPSHTLLVDSPTPIKATAPQETPFHTTISCSPEDIFLRAPN